MYILYISQNYKCEKVEMICQSFAIAICRKLIRQRLPLFRTLSDFFFKGKPSNILFFFSLLYSLPEKLSNCI